eukprot:2333606-Heterocapsa_arctica.AAC.1
MQDIARHPEQHTVLLRALAGSSLSGPLQLIGDHPTHSANPWLKQLWNDFAIAAQRDPELRPHWRRGWGHRFKSLSFTAFRYKKLHEHLILAQHSHIPALTRLLPED